MRRLLRTLIERLRPRRFPAVYQIDVPRGMPEPAQRTTTGGPTEVDPPA